MKKILAILVFGIVLSACSHNENSSVTDASTPEATMSASEPVASDTHVTEASAPETVMSASEPATAEISSAPEASATN